MKLKTISTLVALTALSTLNFQSSTFAQGMITPPAGAPAPVMKSLDQIEARTPISTVPFTINVPGSYYLTTNLAVSSGTAVTVAANNVTLDLNGFGISSTEASPTGDAIRINSSLKNISIENGFIRGGVTNNGSGVFSGVGFYYGINSKSPSPENVRVSRVSVSGCSRGIFLTGESSIVESCNVNSVGGTGIQADVVRGSTVTDCGGQYTIVANSVADCYAFNVSSGIAIKASTVENSEGTSNSGTGIDAYIVSNSFGNGGTGTGIKAINASNSRGNSNGAGNGIEVTETATGCGAFSWSGIGLIATVANNCTAKRAGGRAIQATVANACFAMTGTNLITYKYNMP